MKRRLARKIVHRWLSEERRWNVNTLARAEKRCGKFLWLIGLHGMSIRVAMRKPPWV